MQTHTHTHRSGHTKTQRDLHITRGHLQTARTHTHSTKSKQTHTPTVTPPNTHIYKDLEKDMHSSRGYLQCSVHTSMETKPHRGTQ